MKLLYRSLLAGVVESPPSRRRGLKLQPTDLFARWLVASLAEAWIETIRLPPSAYFTMVASLAEAWIETHNLMAGEKSTLSPPSRRRGLKLTMPLVALRADGRLPRGGVD